MLQPQTDVLFLLEVADYDSQSPYLPKLPEISAYALLVTLRGWVVAGVKKKQDHTAPRKDGLIRPDGHAGIAGSTGQSMIQVRRSGSNLVASSVCIRGSRGLPLGAATWTAVHTARAAGARAAAQPPAAAT